MDAWPASPGEALHTSTHLGHPLACAASLVLLDLLEGGLAERAESLGGALVDRLRSALGNVSGVGEVRGAGLLLGIELVARDGGRTPLPGAASRVAHQVLAEGVLVLPAGDEGHVVELSPPACLDGNQVDAAVGALDRAVRRVLEEAP
jgi:4-aminobutyrate aminotransferase-like enzyme